MSVTDELRRILDERGFEWKGYKPNTWTDTTAWDIDASNPRREVEASFMEFTDTGVTLMRFWNAAPKQAIAATLGEANEDECYLMRHGEKFPVELDYGFIGIMPLVISVAGFRYVLEVPYEK